MIQLNLLPDVKLEYIKAQHQRRMILTMSVLVSVVAIAILVLMLLVDVAQKKHLSDLTHNITSESSKLEGEPQIGKILTVQNQLESLTNLHAGKPAAYNLFNYLNEVTPANVAITSFNTDFTQDTATITGTTDSLASVNTYVDTLKFTTYTTDSSTTSTNAFSNIVLSSFGLNSASSTAQAPQSASYTITLAYDKTIFDITKTVKLSVPSEVTTRSALAQPTDLFQATPSTPANPTNGGTH
ncbi:MAG TPA: PilN domain-containing protein [Candidatus Saccharimonadales bacterium]|jgi:Tfp pilus assembly protein PilN|nr:PilN domain-containing protein [Candidatus Saccharimonadales bacterium]